MTKPVITTRATKGSSLTWTEGDTNLTNLRDATIAIKADTGGTDVVSDLNGTVTLVAGTNVTITGDNTAKTVTIAAAGGGGGLANIVEDLTPQLGGNLDVNGKAIVTVSNGSINLEPNGSGNINLSPATGKVIMSGAEWPTSTGSAGQFLTTSGGTGVLSWATVSGSGLANIVEDTTPQLGGTLDANGNSIDMGTNTITDTKVGNWDTAHGWGNHASAGYLSTETYTGTVTSVGGTGSINGLTLTGTVTSTGNLTLGGTLNLTTAPAIGSTSPNTGKFTSLQFTNPLEPVYSLGTTGGTIAPNCANGSVQKITLNSALTINTFTTPVAGQSLTLLIYGGTAYTSITSTMKFAGGVKTLTATAGCIDILSVYYDGTTYFASLGKGYA